MHREPLTSTPPTPATPFPPKPALARPSADIEVVVPLSKPLDAVLYSMMFVSPMGYADVANANDEHVPCTYTRHLLARMPDAALVRVTLQHGSAPAGSFGVVCCCC